MTPLQVPIERLDWGIRQRARSDPRVKALEQLPGVGLFTALILLAEIGNITRFASARKLASWPGSPPPSAAATAPSGTGTSGKQSLVWARCVLCEAAQTAKRHPDFAAAYQAIAQRPTPADGVADIE